MSAARLFVLTCHPATPCAAVTAVTAALERSAGHWHLRYALSGDIARLRVPQPAPHPGFTDGLWQHTCFEAFVGREDDPAYREFNFSPSGDWAAYAFSAERVRDAAAAPLPAPRIACAREAHRLTLDAWVPGAALPPAHGDTPPPLGLTAVVETLDGALSCWALHHPARQPDFHHRAGWTARLAVSAE